MRNQVAMTLEKIVSGGQTGVDRGALDAALAADFPAGGWCPADRSAEDGSIPTRYPLVPLSRGGYRARTLQNVLHSDATAVLAPGDLTGGTYLTFTFCREHKKPVLVIDAAQLAFSEAAREIASFVALHSVRTLNVAGPRASSWSAAYEFARSTIGALLILETGVLLSGERP